MCLGEKLCVQFDFLKTNLGIGGNFSRPHVKIVTIWSRLLLRIGRSRVIGWREHVEWLDGIEKDSGDTNIYI